MPTGEVIASFHALWQVEASFRMSKSDLRARPIFHHTRDAIEANLTIVFAALAIARYLQGATGLSIKKIVHTLRPIQQIRVHIAGHEQLAEDPAPQQQPPSSRPSPYSLSDTPRWHESGAHYAALNPEPHPYESGGEPGALHLAHDP